MREKHGNHGGPGDDLGENRYPERWQPGDPERKVYAEGGRPWKHTDLALGGRKKGRRGRIDHQNREERAEGGNRGNKSRRDGGEEFETEGGSPSLSAEDGRVYTDSSWRGGGSTSSEVVTGNHGDFGRYAVSGGKSRRKDDAEGR